MLKRISSGRLRTSGWEGGMLAAAGGARVACVLRDTEDGMAALEVIHGCRGLANGSASRRWIGNDLAIEAMGGGK